MDIEAPKRPLPHGWTWANVGDVTAPRGVKVKPADMADAPFIGLEHVEAHTMRLLNIGKASDVRSSASYFATGDVLYGRLRPYLNKVYRPECEGLASGEFIVFPEHPYLYNPYLQYFLNQWEFVSYVACLNTGDRPRVDFNQFATHPIAVAPLHEQRRIVAEIEKQFTRLDASVAALRRTRANLKRYRASVLHSACSGELVPTEAELARAEGREYEPADVLLERILAERRAHWEAQEKRRGKYQEPAAPDTSDLPPLPEGWAWTILDQLIYLLEGGNAATATDRVSERKVLRSSAVRHGLIDLSDYRHLPDDAPEGSDPYIASGDLLFTRLSGTLEYVGNCAVVNEVGGRNFEFPDRIFRGRCVPSVSPFYIQNCFATQGLRNGLEANAKSSAGHQRISLSDLRNFCLPLPPLAEQHRIVAEVERRLSVIQQAEAAVEASLQRAERLRQSILKRAFSGQLAPQDPDDEPASVLLERIRAQREAEPAAASATRKRPPRRKQTAP